MMRQSYLIIPICYWMRVKKDNKTAIWTVFEPKIGLKITDVGIALNRKDSEPQWSNITIQKWFWNVTLQYLIHLSEAIFHKNRYGTWSSNVNFWNILFNLSWLTDSVIGSSCPNQYMLTMCLRLLPNHSKISFGATGVGAHPPLWRRYAVHGWGSKRWYLKQLRLRKTNSNNFCHYTDVTFLV